MVRGAASLAVISSGNEMSGSKTMASTGVPFASHPSTESDSPESMAASGTCIQYRSVRPSESVSSIAGKFITSPSAVMQDAETAIVGEFCSPSAAAAGMLSASIKLMRMASARWVNLCTFMQPLLYLRPAAEQRAFIAGRRLGRPACGQSRYASLYRAAGRLSTQTGRPNSARASACRQEISPSESKILARRRFYAFTGHLRNKRRRFFG